jgi:hypothetical protein
MRVFWGEGKSSQGKANAVREPIFRGGCFIGGVPVGERISSGAVYSLLCPGLGVGPAGGSWVAEFDGGFAGGFVLGEGGFELGKDFVGRFDREKREAVYVTNLKIDSWI